MATKTATIGLNQYVGTDYVKMADFNEDNLAVDNAIKEDREKLKAIEDNVTNIQLVDTKVKITDTKEEFTGTTLDAVLSELKVEMNSKSTDAAGTSFTDTTTQLGANNVQKAIERVVARIVAIETEVHGEVTKLNGINTELSTEIGNPV